MLLPAWLGRFSVLHGNDGCTYLFCDHCDWSMECPTMLDDLVQAAGEHLCPPHPGDARVITQL